MPENRTQPRKSVLIVEDSPPLARMYSEYLKDEDLDLIQVGTGKDALAQLDARLPAAVLLDLNLPDMDGIEILKRVSAQALPTRVIVITAHGSINVAVEAMRLGAHDFLVKPFLGNRLVVTLRNALEYQRLTQVVETIKEEFDRRTYYGFIGSSLAMQAVYHMVDAAGPSKATIFITGESGTGKEVCAEAVHQRSPRAKGPFVALNCAALPRDLIESEIFGHKKGAFTGAVADRVGAAGRANNGTLFLDEICEMDIDLQAKLLRFVQTGTFVRVGGTEVESVDVRIVCATNRDPVQEVRAGRFREDLFYRLHVVPIHLPPLRERDGDVVEVARALLEKYAQEEKRRFVGFSQDAETALSSYQWPGNIRELQNVVRNAVVLHDGERLTGQMLPPLLGVAKATPEAEPAAAPTGDPRARIKPMWQLEQDAIEQALRLCNGNVPRAAALLEISPATVYRKRPAKKISEAEG